MSNYNNNDNNDVLKTDQVRKNIKASTNTNNSYPSDDDEIGFLNTENIPFNINNGQTNNSDLTDNQNGSCLPEEQSAPSRSENDDIPGLLEDQSGTLLTDEKSVSNLSDDEIDFLNSIPVIDLSSQNDLKKDPTANKQNKIEKIEFRCPHCTSKISVSKIMSGKEYLCPFCFHKILVPNQSSKPVLTEDKEKVYGVDSNNIDWEKRKDDYVSVMCPRCRTVIAVEKNTSNRMIVCPDCDKNFDLDENLLEKYHELIGKSDKPQKIELGETYELSASWIPEASKQEKSSNNQKDTFPVYCPVCHTLQYARPDQVGCSIQCPDCFREFKVIRPQGTTPVEKTDPLVYEGSSAYALEGENSSPSDLNNLIPVVCERCGTIVYHQAAEIGQKSRCPDCEHETLIKPVSEEKIRGKEKIQPRDTGVYDFKTTVPDTVKNTSSDAPFSQRQTKENSAPLPNKTSVPPLLPDQERKIAPVIAASYITPPTSADNSSPYDYVPLFNRSSNQLNNQTAVPPSGFSSDAEKNSFNGSNSFGIGFSSPDPNGPPVILSVSHSGTNSSQAGILSKTDDAQRDRDPYSDNGNQYKERDDGRIPVRKGDQIVYVIASPPKNALFNHQFRLLKNPDLFFRSIPLILAGMTVILLAYLIVFPSINIPTTESGAAIPGKIVNGKSLSLIPTLALILLTGVYWFGKAALFMSSIVLAGGTGVRRIGEWYEEDLTGGFIQGFWLLGIVFLSAIPSGITSTVLNTVLPKLPWQIPAISGILLFGLFFPILYLITYQSGGGAAIKIIFKSLFRCFGSWLGFYFQTFLLAGLPLILIIVVGTNIGGVFLWFFAFTLI